MATDNISLEIVTPTGVALRENVLELTAPSVAGEFGVLPGHLPVLAALRTGIVTYRQDGKENKVAVHHGFVEIVNDTALLLTERFAKPSDVQTVQVRKRLEEVDSELDHWEGELTDPRRVELIEEEQWLATQLELIGDAPPPMVREETRYLTEHAEPPPVDELARESIPDGNLTDIEDKEPGIPH
jgi:F-type H+-transporting ATPase subunit epsilon